MLLNGDEIMKANRGRRAGFSLIEMMIALLVGAMLIAITYNVLVSQKKASRAQNESINAQQNARIALETLERELRLAGLNIDDFNGQPVIIDAAPYQIIFNGDVSTGVTGVPGMNINQSVPLSDGVTSYVPGTYPGENLGALEQYNNNAETIRFTLDRSDNGTVGMEDRYVETDNPMDYALYREENGSKKDIIAYGIRGRENYPDGQLPAPLFKYYGDFNGTGNVVLWGDGNGDGGLSQAEMAALSRVPQNQLDKIIEVEVTIEAESALMEAGYAGPHSIPNNPRNYRSMIMTSKVRPRNIGTGSANLHACGDPPASPTSLSAVDTPDDSGESITLTFNASNDEQYGEEDVTSYTIYRRPDGSSEWECIGSLPPKGTSSYTHNDDIHSLIGGPELGVPYYYVVSAWDCRPQESNPSNMAGPVQALPNGPAPPHIVKAYDTPCDSQAEICVLISASPDDQSVNGQVSGYQIYRGPNAGGGILSKMIVGYLQASGSTSYTFYDNSTDNIAGSPPETGGYYYYIARALGSSADTIPSVNSNEYGAVYYSGTISACQLVSVADFPDDEGDALVVTWEMSPSENCVPSEVVQYEVRRKGIEDSDYESVVFITATAQPNYSHIDGDLTRGNEYSYCVYTHSGTDEVPSNYKSGIPIRNTELDPPQNLVAEDILCDDTGAINVTWEHSPQDIPAAGSVTHYLIYRKQDFSSMQLVGETEASGSETYLWVDGPAENPSSPPVIGEFYDYCATAYDDVNTRESSPSNESNTMSDGEPGAPRITSAYDTPADAGGSITVTFDRSADDGHCTSNVIIYKIYRETSDTEGFDDLVGEVTAVGSPAYTYYDEDIFSLDPPVDGMGYYYVIRAYDGVKESVNSNIVGPVYSICQEPSSYIVFEDDFESDKGWYHSYDRTQDDWQLGTPLGKASYYGGPDPTSAHSGSSCYGNDIGLSGWNGIYQNNVDNYLITPEGQLDCYGYSNLALQFYRWLNVEAPAYDQASILISTSGHSGPWTKIWENASEITDSEWVFVEIDISDWADGESDVAIMFRLKSDGSHAYTGWNIDDVVVRENAALP